ncbi:MAG: CNNM domain-containing protein [Pirellulaceae bacterium]|nr:CNNM domain-containing protein [Pirellulaceae bacterium]
MLGVIGVLLSALYSGIETGLYCLNRVRLELHAERGQWAARYLRRMLGTGTMMIVILLVGNNVANYLSTAAVAKLFQAADVSQQRSIFFTCVLVTPVLFVLGEMVPKNLFQKYSDTLSYRFAWTLRVTQLTCGWLAYLVYVVANGLLRLTGLSDQASHLGDPRQRIRAMLRDTQAAGVISRHQSDIVDRVMGLAQVPLRSVLIPMSRVVAVDVNAQRTQLIELIRPHPFSRVPVYEGARNNLLGVLNIYDVLADSEEENAVRKHLQQAVQLSDNLGISHALFRLQRHRQTIGIVTDRRNRAIGIVTIKDLVEEIVGELQAW